MRRFSDDLIGASSFEAVADVLADAVREGAIPILIDELALRARSELKPKVRAWCAELARLLREVERTSLFDALTACRALLRKLMTIVAATTWVERDRALGRYVTLAYQSPSITMAWFFLTTQDTKYIWRLISALKRVEASSPRRGFIASAADDKESLRMLVEDLSAVSEGEERLAVLRQYAELLRNRFSDDEIKRAFSDSYHGWRVKPPRREYLSLLLRWSMELGAAEVGAAHDRHNEDLISLIAAETDEERIAVLERVPHIITRDAVTLINFSLSLASELPDAEIDKAERAREIISIAVHRPPGTAVQLSRRKRELALRHVFRLLTAQSTRKQIGILRRNKDTLVSAHAAQRLDILRRTYEQQQPLSAALQTAFDRTRIVLAEARGDDVWAAINLLEAFQSFMDIVNADEAAIAKALEEHELTLGDHVDRALTLLGEIYLRGSDAFARSLLGFGATVSRAFAGNDELVVLALRAVEMARRDERLSPSQRAYSDQVSAELYERHGETATAIERYESALAAYTEQRVSAGVAVVHAKLAELYPAGSLERVKTHANVALRLFRDSDLPPTTTVPLLLTLADAYAAQPDESHRSKAAEYYAEALALAADDGPLQVRCNQTLAALLRGLGRTKEAIDALRAAHARQRELAKASDNPALRGVFGISLRVIVSALLDLLLTTETPAAERIEAFEILDEAKGWELQRDTQFTSLLYAEGLSGIPPDARSKLLSYLQQRYAMQEMEPEAWAEFDDVMRSAAAEALAPLRSELDDPGELDQFIAKVPEFYAGLALRLAYGGEMEVVPARVAAWKEAAALLETLGHHTAIVSYLVTGECIHSLLLRHGLDAPEYVRVPLGEEQWRRRFLASYAREVMEPSADRRQARHAWQEVGELLLAPLEPLLGDVDVLYVVPDERLFWLPFNALLVDGRPYCFRRAAVMIPSVDYFERRVRLLAPPFEEIGTVGAVGYTANENERNLFESEAKAVAGYFGGELLAGGDATRQRVAELAGGLTGLLHVSAHGKTGDDDDDEPVLYLADGALPALDWMTDVRSTVRLCTFSACEVGRAQLSHRKPFFGFPRAALLGGAHAVLAPLWSVDAKAAADFCLSFYQLTWSPDGRRKLPLAEGYRRALAAQAERPGIGVHDWASFSLAGDGR